MSTVSFRIGNRVADSFWFNDNRYAKSTSKSCISEGYPWVQFFFLLKEDSFSEEFPITFASLYSFHFLFLQSLFNFYLLPSLN